ncbi:MAG: lysophospholipase [Salinisphaera sp.]|nr:lysophospholipase [Salinisphaera sp.]
MDWWLAHGYAVVAPDYQGLGTPGGHPYMNADSHLHAVVDSVRAIHQLRPEAIGSDWIVMGHSQGGAAALAVAAGADAAQLNLRGAIAIAPGGYQYDGIAEYALQHDEVSPGVAAFLPIVLLGAEAAKPALQVEQLVSQEMQPLMDLARSRCLSGLRTEITEGVSQVFKEDADLKPLLTYLGRQSIEHMAPTVPVLFIQGSEDQLVNPGGPHAYYQQLCKAGKTVFYHPIPGGSHRDALRQSPPVSKAFLAYLNGQETLQSCASANSAAEKSSG